MRQTIIFLFCYLPMLSVNAQCMLAGHVYDKKRNENMSFVNIRVSCCPTQLPVNTFTDSLGKYYLDSIPEGRYDVRFSDYNQQYLDTIVRNVQFTRGQTVKLDIYFPTFCEYAGSSKKCPICKKKNKVIPILYGDPTHEMLKNLKRGKIYSGGCLITGCDAKWYCTRDQRKF